MKVGIRFGLCNNPPADLLRCECTRRLVIPDHHNPPSTYMRTACIMRMQKLGYSPKNTRHLSSSMAKQQSPPVVHVTPFKCPTRSTIVRPCVLCWEC